MSWTHVRKEPEAWQHVVTSIAGESDTAACTLCDDTVELETHRRASDLRLFTRRHFNKHKLEEHVRACIAARAVPETEEVPLFAETEN